MASTPTSMAMSTAQHNASSAGNTPPTSTSTALTIAPTDLEHRLHQTLNYYNKLAKNLDINASGPESGIGPAHGHEVEAAKMLNYAIRMLHADGWHPPTIIRAMVLRECNPEASLKGTMYRALRERRKEIEVWRMQKRMVPEGEGTAGGKGQGRAGGGRKVGGGGGQGQVGSGASTGGGYVPAMSQGGSGSGSGRGGQGQLDQFMSLI